MPERVKIQKKLDSLDAELARANKKLQNIEFNERAPAHIIDGVKARKDELIAEIETLKKELSECET